jgi:PAS domain S-box-containing protein
MDPQDSPNRKQSAAEVVRTSKEEILSRWEILVRREVDEAKKQSRSNLRDAIPKFLDSLGNALSRQEFDSKVRSSLIQVASEHAEDRAYHSDYDVESVILEYDMLRKVIFDTLDRRQLLTAAAREMILDAITAAMGKATAQFSELAYQRQSRLQSELEDSAELFKAVFDMAAAGKAVIEAKTGQFIQVNKKLSEILMYSQQELLKKRWADIALKESQNVPQKFSEFGIEATPSSTEALLICKNNRSLWTLMSAAFLPSKSASPDRIIVTIFDISEQKQNQQRLQALHALNALALSKSRVLHDLLDNIVVKLTEIFNSDLTLIFLVDNQDSTLSIQAAHGQHISTPEVTPEFQPEAS